MSDEAILVCRAVCGLDGAVHVVPLLFVCYYAFTTRTGEFTTENLTRIFDYAPVLFDSLRLALYCTALCLLIGYPAAYFMASRDMSRNKSLACSSCCRCG